LCPRLLSLHLERLADITQLEIESNNRDNFEVSKSHLMPAQIEFRNVRFRYSENDPWVLDDISG